MACSNQKRHTNKLSQYFRYNDCSLGSTYRQDWRYEHYEKANFKHKFSSPSVCKRNYSNLGNHGSQECYAEKDTDCSNRHCSALYSWLEYIWIVLKWDATYQSRLYGYKLINNKSNQQQTKTSRWSWSDQYLWVFTHKISCIPEEICWTCRTLQYSMPFRESISRIWPVKTWRNF